MSIPAHKIPITHEELLDLQERIEERITSGNPINEADLKTLSATLNTFVDAYHLIVNGSGIANIRKLLNVYPSKVPDLDSPPDNGKNSDNKTITTNDDDDKNENPIPDPEKKPENSSTGSHSNGGNKNHHGKSTSKNYPTSRKIELFPEGVLEKGSCPHCGKGKLYKFIRNGQPRTGVWMMGNAPIQPQEVIHNDLRCNNCETVFKATPTQELIDDGFEKEDRFGYSCQATVVLMKYLFGTPWYRMAGIQETHNIPISESSMFDICERVSNIVFPVYNYLKKQIAPTAPLFFGDDTTNNIRSLQAVMQPNLHTGTLTVRDGGHSSVIIAETSQGQVVLVKTHIIHFGEWLTEILNDRPKDLPKPLVMSDGSSSNNISIIPVIKLDCNQHARQKFKDIQDQFPKLIRPILNLYKAIFKNDHHTKTKEMTAPQRQEYHKVHSLSLMDQIHDQIVDIQTKKITTDNSKMGQAMNYFLAHETKLRGFIDVEGAPLSNNVSENMMITIAILRKNAGSFLNETGATIASVLFSILFTARAANIDIRDYLISLQRHQEEVKKTPQNFLPWNYKKTIETITHQPSDSG